MSLILLFAFLGLSIIAAFKESRITSTYKQAGVYGRFKAYMALSFTGVGIMGLLSLIFPQLTDGYMPLYILLCLPLGLALYVTSYMKCPDNLKAKCIPSMIMTGLGVSAKLLVFFLPVWTYVSTGYVLERVAVPTTIYNEFGHSCRVHHGSSAIVIMDEFGRQITATDDNMIWSAPNSFSVNGVNYYW